MNPLLFPLFAEQKGGGAVSPSSIKGEENKEKNTPAQNAGVFFFAKAVALRRYVRAAWEVDPDAGTDRYVISFF